MRGDFYFPWIEQEEIDELIFFLNYGQHGGSGLTLGGEFIQDLEWARACWYAERLEEQRRREKMALERAARSK